MTVQKSPDKNCNGRGKTIENLKTAYTSTTDSHISTTLFNFRVSLEHLRNYANLM